MITGPGRSPGSEPPSPVAAPASRGALGRLYVLLAAAAAAESVWMVAALGRWGRSGEIRWIEVAAAGLGLALLLVIVMAVRRLGTTAAESRRELREAHDRYARAVHAIGEGIWEWDMAADTVYHSPTARAILGLAHESIHPARAWFDAAVHPDDAERLSEVVARALNASGRYSVDFRLRGDDGRYRWIRSFAAVSPDESGRPRWLSGSSKDIEEEREARQSLGELQLVLSDSPDGIARVDDAGNFTLVNPACISILRRQRAELLGLSCRAVIHPDDAPEFDGAIARLRGDGRAECELRAVTPSGAVLGLRLAMVSCRALSAASSGYFCFMTDVTKAREAEAALRMSEQRFRAVVEMQTELICRWRPDGTLTFVNEAYCRYFGRGREEFIGHSFVPLIPEEDRGVIAEVLSRITPEHPSVTVEHRVLAPGGWVRWLRWTDRALFDAEGRIEEYQAVGADITELKRSEAELRASVQRFQALAQLAPVGIFQSDEHGRNVFMNETWCRLTGLSIEQGQGYGWREAIHPDDRDRIDAEFIAAVSEDRDFVSEFRYRRPVGTVVHGVGVARALRDPEGRVLGYLGAVSDITGRKRIEAELRASVDRFQTLAQLAPVGIYQTGADGACHYVNHHWSRLTGLSPEQAAGSGWRRAIHPDDLERVSAGFEAAVVRREDFSAEYRYRRPDGSVVSVIGVATALRDEHDRVTGYLGAVSDISALKAAEVRIREGLAHQQELARRERSLRRELDHRVRNNLTGLLALVRVYRRSGEPGAIEQIEGKVRAMSEVHDMIAAAEGRDVEVGPLVKRLSELILGPGGSARVQVPTDRSAIPSARASALAMIVQELLTNSLKHGAMSPGDRPDGEPDRHQARRIDVTWGPRPNGEPGFVFRWAEQMPIAVSTEPDGSARPRVESPVGGVGLSLIRGLATSELQGGCEFAIGERGMEFVLSSGVSLYNRPIDPNAPARLSMPRGQEL